MQLAIWRYPNLHGKVTGASSVVARYLLQWNLQRFCTRHVSATCGYVVISSDGDLMQDAAAKLARLRCITTKKRRLDSRRITTRCGVSLQTDKERSLRRDAVISQGQAHMVAHLLVVCSWPTDQQYIGRYVVVRRSTMLCCS